MKKKSQKLNSETSLYQHIILYRVTIILLILLLLVSSFIVFSLFFPSSVSVPVVFATDPAWLLPSPTPTVTETPTPIPTSTAISTIPPTETPTNTLEPPTLPGEELFIDDFESGDFQAWTSFETGSDAVAEVQQENVWDGEYSVHLSESENSNSYAYLRKSLDQPAIELRVSGYFFTKEEGFIDANVPLFRLFNPSEDLIISFYRQNLSEDRLWLGYDEDHFLTDGVLPLNTWVHIELQVTIAGEGASIIKAYLDGNLIYETFIANLDEEGILIVQIGNNTSKQTFELYADNLVITR